MKNIPLLWLTILCCWVFSSPVWSAQQTSPQVVVSIKPIHSLVSAVMQGVGVPQLLIKGGSPHGYVLRPSEARALARADLIIWIGHQLESFLEKPLMTLGQNARQLQLIEVLRPQLLPVREQGSWDRHKDDDHEQKHAKGGEVNPHLWLNPLLAKQVVAQAAVALAEIDPAHQQQYQENAKQLGVRLDRLHVRLKAQLAPVKDVPYVVFHDAYQYFETAYGLNAIGSISIDPERQPGVKRIREIRRKITSLNARCVFSEPQFKPRLLATLIEGTGAGTGILDPLGADLAAGPESYFLLMNRLVEDLLRGLE